jgi:hypothetical protein
MNTPESEPTPVPPIPGASSPVPAATGATAPREIPPIPAPVAAPAAGEAARPSAYRTQMLVGWALFVIGCMTSLVPFFGLFIALVMLLVCVVLAIIILARNGTAPGVVLLLVTLVVGIPVSFIGSCVGTTVGTATAVVGGAAATAAAVGNMDAPQGGVYPQSAIVTKIPRDETPQQILDRHAEEYAIVYARGRFMHEIWLRFKENFTNAEAEKLITAVRDELKTNGYGNYIKLNNKTLTAWTTFACGLGANYKGVLEMEASAWNAYGDYQEQPTMFEAHLALMLDEAKRKNPPALVLPNLGADAGRAEFVELWKARDMEAHRLHYKYGPVRCKQRVDARARAHVNTLLRQTPRPPMEEIETLALQNLKDDYTVKEALRYAPGIDLRETLYAVTRNKTNTAKTDAGGSAPISTTTPAGTQKIAPAASLPTATVPSTAPAPTAGVPVLAITKPAPLPPDNSAPATPATDTSTGTGTVIRPGSGSSGNQSTAPKIAPSGQ